MRLTLLTDFGTVDGYVAAMKAVIAGIAPGIIIDDASHAIPPGDVRSGAWALGAYWRQYPRGTVHVVVVDPGVGSGRRALALECDGRFLVGPDNGVLAPAITTAEAWRAVSIENDSYVGDIVSATFHGRDVFAPAAAYLARGVTLEELGPSVSDPVLPQTPEPSIRDGVWYGAIIHVDRFGNLVTNLPATAVAEGTTVSIGSRHVQMVRTYADVGEGEVLALVGSRGLVELSVRNGNAATLLGVGRGDIVTVPRGPRP